LHDAARSGVDRPCTGRFRCPNEGLCAGDRNRSNPHIRHLAIAGRDVGGHLPGDAIVNLHARGVSPQQRIAGAKGARPVLKNTLPEEIAHFRRQVALHDFRGCEDADSLSRAIESLRDADSEPFEHGLCVRLVDVIEAKPARRLRLDPEGYFVILVRRGAENPLYVEHYRNDGRLAHIVAGGDAPTVCSTILDMNLVSQLDHAAYLGRELAKAESSLHDGCTFVQDRAQGDIDAADVGSKDRCLQGILPAR
jgi:tetrahydromethanopterin S-methyltransferase subunit A